jgi:dihydropteroate synthase
MMTESIQGAPAASAPEFGSRTLLMGVLNVTPDSFSDGGSFADPRAAAAHARRMVSEGADVIDIGGESTRPGAAEVDGATEIMRIRPVIMALAPALSAPISVDTYKAATAAAALEAGARIVNDVWGFRRDPDIARVAAAHGALSILTHNPGHDAPRADDIAEAVKRGLAKSVEIALAAGLPQGRIVLDPGVGFGKTIEQNLWLIREIGWLKREFGLPVMIGASRKGMIGKILDRPDPKDRLAGTLALHVAAALAGADMVRAHDVAAHRDALKMVEALKAA